jgi:hypothetical protein
MDYGTWSMVGRVAGQFLTGRTSLRGGIPPPLVVWWRESNRRAPGSEQPEGRCFPGSAFEPYLRRSWGTVTMSVAVLAFPLSSVAEYSTV